MSETLISRCDALAERIVLPAFTISREDFLNTPISGLLRTIDEETRLAISLLSALMLFVTRYMRADALGGAQDPTLKGIYRLLGTGGVLRAELPLEARAVESEVPLAVFWRIREIARGGACDAESLGRQVEWGQVEARMTEAIALREDQRTMVVSIVRCVLERCVSGGLGEHARPQERRLPSGPPSGPRRRGEGARANLTSDAIEQ